MYIIQPKSTNVTVIEGIKLIKASNDLIICAGSSQNFRRFDALLDDNFLLTKSMGVVSLSKTDQEKILRMRLIRSSAYHFGGFKKHQIVSLCYLKTQAMASPRGPARLTAKALKFRPGLYDSTTNLTYTLTSQEVNSLPIGEQLSGKNSYIAYSGFVEKGYRLTSPEIEKLSHQLTNEHQLLEAIDVINTHSKHSSIFHQQPHPTVPNALISRPKNVSQQEFHNLLIRGGVYKQHAQLSGLSEEKYFQGISQLTGEEIRMKIIQGAGNLQELAAAILEIAKLLEHLKNHDSPFNS